MKTNDVISQQMEKFENCFVDWNHTTQFSENTNPDAIKSFLRSSFLALLESIQEEVVGGDITLDPSNMTNAELSHAAAQNKLKQKQRLRLTETIKTVKKE